jgi:hypothetical protein
VATYVTVWAEQWIQRAVCAKVEAGQWPCSGQDGVIYRSRVDGSWNTTHLIGAVPDNANPIPASDPAFSKSQADASTFNPAPAKLIARARQFARTIGVAPSCVIITVPPPFKLPPPFEPPDAIPQMYQVALAAGFHVIVPQLDTVSTWDKVHMLPKSAARWSEDFYRQADAVISECLQER